MTETKNSIVAVFPDHGGAEGAVRKVAEAGLDMRHFSIVGRGYHSEEQVIGFYDAGDRIQFWGSRGAFWGGLWGLMFGGMMMTIPVIGPVVVLGQLATLAFTGIVGVLEGAVVFGGLGALGAALFSIGIPRHSVLQCEEALKADSFLVVGHGSADEIDRARKILHVSGPTEIMMHAAGKDVAPMAA